MLEQIFVSGGILLKNFIQKDPGIIVGPIATVFGYLLDIFYELSVIILPSEHNTLGLAIILLTIATKLIMLPLGIKSQKSMAAMQKLQPEMQKIQEKYGDSKDPEIQQKMNMEVQKLYSEHKANPFMGCLPLFIQMPIFMALYYIMNQSYRFVNRLNAIYVELSSIIMEIPGYLNVIKPLAWPKVPKGMEIFLTREDDMVKVLGKFVQEDWNLLFTQIDPAHAASIQSVLDKKSGIENFFGIVLTENTSLSWPAIILPIICVVATFLSSYLSNKQTKSTDPSMKMQQNMMMIVMPVMMGFITLGMPAGVGLYWAVSNITQIIQQVALNKVFNKPDNDSKDEIVDPKPVKSTKDKKK